MAIDKSAFLLMVGALAAGGAGGYYYHASSTARSDARPDGTPPPTSPPAPVASASAPASASTASSASASASTVAASAAPACDDAAGTPGDCPSSGPPSSSDEGICGGNSIAVKRCRDFKASFKPRVAALAVACIRKLVGDQLCDPARANLCGHEALMLACHEPLSPAQSTLTSASLAAAPPESMAASNSGDPPKAGSPVATQCATILKGCVAAVTPVSLADCHRTLSGMTESGRAGMVACMKTNCDTKGLLGCEGLPPPA